MSSSLPVIDFTSLLITLITFANSFPVFFFLEIMNSILSPAEINISGFDLTFISFPLKLMINLSLLPISTIPDCISLAKAPAFRL